MSSNTPTEGHYVAPPEAVKLAEVDTVSVQEQRSNLWLDAWRDMRKRPLFWISAATVLVVLIVALVPWVFTAESPSQGCLLANSNGGPEAGHPLGFTRQGCDVWARIVHGASSSVSVGLIAVFISTTLGVVFGAFAGFYGGWIDSVLSRIGDIFFSIPYILAAVVVMSVLSEYRSVWVVALAIGGFSWAATARVLRGEVLRVRNNDFVQASRALGMSRFTILLKHVLPNSIAPVIVVSTIALALSIVAEATLSFLGVGLPGSVMSWGNDISQAQVDIRTSPQTLLYPSIALSITVLAFIMLGEVLRDALDPKARARR